VQRGMTGQKQSLMVKPEALHKRSASRNRVGPLRLTCSLPSSPTIHNSGIHGSQDGTAAVSAKGTPNTQEASTTAKLRTQPI
jgi:hypothetical protein